MIKVYQSDTGTPGDAFAACIASMMEIGIADMPPLHKMPRPQAEVAMTDFLHALDMQIQALGTVRRRKGWAIMTGFFEGTDAPHSVIVFDGQVFHDPHPHPPGRFVRLETWVMRTLDEVAREND